MLLEIDTLIALSTSRSIRVELIRRYICCRSYSTSTIQLTSCLIRFICTDKTSRNMFERTVHVIFCETITEFITIHRLPFVIELREIHHYITLCSVQFGSCSVLIIVAIIIP